MSDYGSTARKLMVLNNLDIHVIQSQCTIVRVKTHVLGDAIETSLVAVDLNSAIHSYMHTFMCWYSTLGYKANAGHTNTNYFCFDLRAEVLHRLAAWW